MALGQIKAAGAYVMMSLQDKLFQQGLKNVERKMQDLRTKVRSSVSISENPLGPLLNGLRQAFTGTQRLASAWRNVGNSIRGVGQTLTASGIGALFAASIPVRGFIEFQDNIKAIIPIASASTEEIKRLEEQARQLGRSTSFTPQEVAETQRVFGQKGFTPQEIEDAVASTLDLAKATRTDLAESADIAGTTMKQFGLDSSEVVRISDVLVATVNTSAQNMTELGEAFNYAAVDAKNAGATLEEVAAAIAILANNGVRASVAGTGLRRAWRNLGDQALRTKFIDNVNQFLPEGDKILEGDLINKVTGDFLKLSEVIRLIGDRTQNIGTANRAGAFETLFGRGTLAAQILASNADALDAFEAMLDNVRGTSRATAEIMESGLGGAMRKFISATQDAAISVGEVLAPSLEGILATGTDFVNKLSEWITENGRLVTTIALLVPTVTALGTAMLFLGTAIAISGTAAFTTLSVLGTIGGLLTGSVGGPILAVSSLLLAGGAAWARYSETGQLAFAAISDAANRFGGRASGALSGIFAAISGGDFQATLSIATKFMEVEWARVLDFWETNFGTTIDRIAEAVKAVPTVLSETAISLATGISTFMGAALSGASDAVASVSLGAADAVVSSFSVMSAAASAFVGTLTSTVSDIFSSLVDALVEIDNVALSGFFQFLINIIPKAVSKTVSGMLSLGSAIGSAIGYVIGLGNAWDESIGIDDAINDLNNTIPNFVNSIVSAISRPFIAIGSFISETFSGIASSVGTFGTFMANVAGGWLEAFTGAFGGIREFFASAVNKMSDGWHDFALFVAESWISAETQIKIGFARTLEAFGQLLKDTGRESEGGALITFSTLMRNAAIMGEEGRKEQVRSAISAFKALQTTGENMAAAGRQSIIESIQSELEGLIQSAVSATEARKKQIEARIKELLDLLSKPPGSQPIVPGSGDGAGGATSTLKAFGAFNAAALRAFGSSLSARKTPAERETIQLLKFIKEDFAKVREDWEKFAANVGAG